MNIDGFVERLKTAIGDESVNKFAKKCGFAEGSLRQYLSGNSLPGLDKAMKMAQTAKVNLQWLATGEGPMRATEGGHGDTIGIPLYNVTGSAGGGLLNDHEHVEKVIYCSQFFIHQVLGVPPAVLCMIHVTGNSMEPDLPSNSIVFVDRRGTDAKPDGIYVIRVEGTIMVKQLQRLPGGIIVVSSINTTYKAFEITPANPPDDFAILGRVVCTFKKL